MTANTKKRTARARLAKKTGRARQTKKTGDVRSKPNEGRTSTSDKPVTGKGLRYLRGLGHHLDPVVQLGKDGLTDAVVAATREQLVAHELVKIRVGSESPIDRKEVGAALATATGSVLVQTLGRTLLLYKRHPQKPKIEIPR